MKKENSKKEKLHARVLFMNDSEESKKAEEILKKNNLSLCGRVKNSTKSDLPLLVTGDGPLYGLKEIEDYAKAAAALGER